MLHLETRFTDVLLENLEDWLALGIFQHLSSSEVKTDEIGCIEN